MVAMTQTILDSFSDGVLTGWSDWSDGQASETAGEFRITSRTSGGYWGVDWGSTVDYSNNYYGAHLISAGNLSLASYNVSAARAIIDGANNFYWFVHGIGGAQAVLNVDNSFEWVGPNLDYDPDVHKYFALGIHDGQIEWVWSTDGVNWTVHHSEPNPFGTTLFVPSMMVGQDAPEASTTTARWDNFSRWQRIEGEANFDLLLSVATEGFAPVIGSAGSLLALQLEAAGVSNLGGEGTAATTVNFNIEATGLSIVLTPVRVLTPQEVLSGNRRTKFRVDVLDANENPLFTLDGQTDGELDWIANAMVKGGGKLSIQDVGQDIDWLNVRFKPYMMIDGIPPQPLGVFLVSEAPVEYSSTNRSWSVKLLDKTTILHQDTVATSYAVPAGTVVTTEVKNLIESSGISNHSITPSSATVPYGLLWEPGTSKLRIINDLLNMINYFSLYANFEGQLIAEPYTLPAQRAIFYEFIDGSKSIYEPNFQRDIDIWKVPNRVTVVGVGDSVNPALSSTIDNTDPSSPYSIPARGRVIGYVETGVEAADQSALDAYARRRLVELTSPTATVQINHAPVPGLTVNQVVRFRRVPAGIDHRHVVVKTSIKLRGSALATSTFREVVDL